MTTIELMNCENDKVIAGIANGEVKKLNMIIIERRDVESGSLKDTIVRFAGTTDKELKDAFAETIKNTQSEDSEETISVIAATEDVMHGYIDEDSDDAEAAMEEMLQWIYDRNNYNVLDSEDISYNYESLEGAILVNWSWDKYVGYARNFDSVEYCTDKTATTKDCLPVDAVNKLQQSCLISASELADIASVTDLIARLEAEIKSMGKWNQAINIEEAVRQLYEDAERHPNLYYLPVNNMN